jgi:hypothetical protein
MHDAGSRGDPLARRAAAILREESSDEQAIERVIAALKADATRTHAERAATPVPIRRLSFSPWSALAAAVLIFAVGLGAGALLLPRRTNSAALPSVTGVPAGAQTVEFVFVAPRASRVSLVGAFNGWDAKATPMRTTGNRGTWAVSVPLAQGRHVYAFVVDDSTWVPDPQAPLAPEQWYGERNSVVVVARDGGRT